MKTEATYHLLGVRFHTNRGHKPPPTSKAIPMVKSRCTRIVTSGGNFSMRKHLVQATVLTLVARAGTWLNLSTRQEQHVNATIERALSRTVIPGRSRYMLWATMGPQYNVDFARIRRSLARGLQVANRALWADAGAAAAPPTEDTKRAVPALGWS